MWSDYSNKPLRRTGCHAEATTPAFREKKVIGGFKNRGAILPDLKWEIKEVLVAGDRIIVRGEGSGTPSGTFLGIPASGKNFKIMAIDVHTVEDGKIKRTFHVEDWAGAMRQLSGGT